MACFLVPTDTDGFSSQEMHGKLGLQGLRHRFARASTASRSATTR